MAIVPGVGFAGLGQMVPASQLVFRKAAGRGGGARTRGGRARSRKRAAIRATGNNRRRSYASGPRTTRAASNRRVMSKSSGRGRKLKRLVRGSAAAKRHMARLRRMRKR